MTLMFLASVIAGMVLGAPVGAAGAMVADAALAHNRRRLELTVASAVAGDTTLALLVSFFALQLGDFLLEYREIGLLIAGFILLIMGLAMLVLAFIHHWGVPDREHLPGSFRWLLGHAAPTVAVFAITVCHPGNIAAYLAAAAFFAMKFDAFSDHPWIFVVGFGTGSGLSFSSAGFLFWKIRQRADRFVHHFRYTLAVIVGGTGVYLLIRHFILNH